VSRTATSMTGGRTPCSGRNNFRLTALAVHRYI
jgi:hypothetical protein